MHALLGGNGSGKPTTIRILAGVVSADAGEVESGGVVQPASVQGCGARAGNGIASVHQQNSTFSDMNVAEKLRPPGLRTGFAARIEWRRQRKHAAGFMARKELVVSPDAHVSPSCAAVQLMVPVGRALQDQDDEAAGVLVLDEPTARSPKSEVDRLLELPNPTRVLARGSPS